MIETLKSKIIDFTKNVKIEGIVKRWLINFMGTLGLAIIIIFVVFSIFVKNYYYNSVEKQLSPAISDSSISYFETNLKNGYSIESSAADFIDEYKNKNNTTIWVIDSEGNVVLSSSGFSVEKQEMTDYDEALSSDEGLGYWVGHLDNTNEKVMAKTRIIKLDNAGQQGAIRVMTSVEKVDNQISTLKLIMAMVFIIFIAIIAFSSLYFIRTIIIPVQQVSDATKLIAQGNLDVRIEKKYNDEIGDLSENINKMATEISTADKMKNDFLSTISHELRTPLTSIKGWAETLDDDDVDETTHKGLVIIEKEARRLEGFVEELLDFSRLQSGRMKLKLRNTDVFAELEDSLFIFREKAYRGGYKLKENVTEIPSITQADPDRIKQVFLNILDNAMKYSRPGSTVMVRGEYVKKDDKDFARIVIVDQGQGISEKDLPHVKEKFYKANLSVKGSGIGLAVCDEIINLHNGSLEVKSALDKGTMVTIDIPVTEIFEEEALEDES